MFEGAPFQLFCDNLVRAVERTGDRALTILLHAGEIAEAIRFVLTRSAVSDVVNLRIEPLVQKTA